MKTIEEAESKTLLNVLCLEDDIKDAELEKEMLEDAGYLVSMNIAKNEKEFGEFLKDGKYDLILADNSVTSFDALAALKVAKALQPEIPFICISGTIGEENAVELLKQGASDYVIKARMNKFTFAVGRALKEKEVQNKLRDAEAFLVMEYKKYHELIDSISDVFFALDKNLKYTYWNKASETLTGVSTENAIGKSLKDIFPDNKARQQVEDLCLQVIESEKSQNLVVNYPGNDNLVHEISAYPNIEGVSVFIKDVTERKHAEEAQRKWNIQFTKLSQNAPGLIYQITRRLDGTFYVPIASEGIREIYGCSPEDVLEDFSPIAKVIYPDDFDRVVEGIEYSAKHLTLFTCEYRVQIKGKPIQWSYAKSMPEKLADGTITWYGFNSDITELKRNELELINAKVKAEESDRLKSAFLTNMSHEIRTPMNGIIGFTDLLKEPNLSIDEQQDFIQTIQISSERMLNTINSIVDMSKIESGIMILNNKETNINGKIEFAYKFFKPDVERKGLLFTFKNGLPTKDAVICTDNEKVYAVLTNLIKNAIKFTYDGSIEFGYDIVRTQNSTSLQFFVKDTGIGIPETQKEMIFERFIQGSGDLNRLYEGSGLGLSISKSYVEMLGGRIWVESEEGKGSTFYFTIPYHSAEEEKAEKADLVSAELEEVKAENLKILIVEDDEVSDSLLTRMLQRISYEILHAITGVQAIEACKNNPDLDLILMDIRMPVMDGNEATRQIRQFNKDVIIIAQTAYGYSHEREKTKEAGCNDFISKPINMTLLHELIKIHCNK